MISKHDYNTHHYWRQARRRRTACLTTRFLCSFNSLRVLSDLRITFFNYPALSLSAMLIKEAIMQTFRYVEWVWSPLSKFPIVLIYSTQNSTMPDVRIASRSICLTILRREGADLLSFRTRVNTYERSFKSRAYGNHFRSWLRLFPLRSTSSTLFSFSQYHCMKVGGNEPIN